MTERLIPNWRILAAGLSFVAFGIGGVLLRIIVFPFLYLLIWSRKRRILLARSMIRLIFRFYIGLMGFMGVLRYEIQGLDKLNRGSLLILANHPTLLDTVFLMAFVKRADCIVKANLLNNPFTRGPVRAAGYINNEHGHDLVADCIASLRCGNNLIVFPEGTRTPIDGVISMKRGAANIAVRGRCNMTPVVIRCSSAILGKGQKWWQVPKSPVRFEIQVQEDIAIHDFIANDIAETRAARHLTEYLQQYFTRKYHDHV